LLVRICGVRSHKRELLKKRISLFHNPDAGSSDHSQKDLRERIEDAGFSVIFSTTDADDVKKTIPDMTDFVVIAGGDGMVRKVVDQMLNRRIMDGKFPLAVIPLGTANNIAKTLGLPTDIDKAIGSWKNASKKSIDVAKLCGMKSAGFFIEGLGYGLFPKLISEMKLKENKSDDPQTELATASAKLHSLAKTMKPELCTLTVDGETFKGNLLLAEVMNMKTVGPNLMLSPDTDPSDGMLEVVYVTDDERDMLSEFTKAKRDGTDKPLKARVLRGKSIQLTSENGLVHVDDKLFENKKDVISIELRKGLLEFLV
jgi:diacylglycerol kinase (ATP)